MFEYNKHQPEHLGISHTAIDVGVQSGAQSAFSFSWLTFIASIQAPIVTSSLLNIRKLQFHQNLTHYKQQKDFKRKQETKISICSLFNIMTSFLSDNNISENFHGQRYLEILNYECLLYVAKIANQQKNKKRDQGKKTNFNSSIVDKT